ncbi:helix-turn-helix domain-containing protein [Halorubrum sp. Atlit-28R]|jgi:DNA-binding transcriptional ArsR family regulator|uniref:ArsR/SmtB family transcription factor n=1 Tax=Halorubrum sp. Atlit-28R TaxID=2282129 RepID=UPI000EF1ABBE|nr:helix-turn-helix domain-containing protein [Halorubrum sp. Atlit-28R]RLM51794.1 ArsR family transcriptional regulator [Halorubrum sp. Atlit-28R]
MDEADRLASVVELLADPYARDILAAASEEAVDAAMLAERLDADLSTVYRRLEALEEHDLVRSRVRPRRDGHHYNVYRTRLRRVTVDIEDGEYRVDIERETPTDPADRLTDLFEEIR